MAVDAQPRTDIDPISPQPWVRFIPALILFVGLIAFQNSFSTSFLLDDMAHIVGNTEIQSFWQSIQGSTRPLVDLSFHLNYQFAGLNTPDYHAVNVAIHLAAALALYGVIRRSLRLWGATAGRAAGLAGITSALWAAHPLQTESVTYIVQRAESMMGLALLGTLYLALRALDSNRPDRWETGAVVVCALGMACKPIMIVAPLIICCFDRVLATRTNQATPARRKALYIALFATWLIPLALLTVPNDSSESTGSKSGVTMLQYAQSQPGVVLHYMRLVFWPYRLCLDYAWPIATRAIDIIPGLVAMGALLVGSVVAFVRRKPFGFLGLAFFVLLAPTSSFFPVADIAFEHRMYLPLAAVLVVVVLGVDMIFRHAKARWPGQAVVVNAGAGILVLIALTGSVVLTRVRNLDYASPLRMWENVVSQRPDNYRARLLVGELTMQAGRLEDGEQWARKLVADIRSVERNASSSTARVRAATAGFYYNLALYQHGRALLALGRAQEALECFEEARRANPSSTEVAVNTAMALNALGRQAEALEVLERATRINPRQAAAWALQGRFRLDAGQYSLAAESFECALRLNPKILLAQRDLAWVLASAPTDSVRNGTRALFLARQVCVATDYRSVAGLDVLAAALAECGEWVEAVEIINQAITQSSSARSKNNGTGDATLSGLIERRTIYLQQQAYRFPTQNIDSVTELKSTELK